MKTIKLILKGILFYTTIITVMVLVVCVDALCDNGYLFIGVSIIAALVYTCYKTISERDLYILSGHKLSDDEL